MKRTNKSSILNKNLSIFLVVLIFAGIVVSRVSAEGAWVGLWDVLLDGNGNVNCPGDLAVDSNQTLYTVDLGFQLVQKKEKTASAWTFLPSQPYNGTTHFLVDIAVDSANNVYVLNGYSGSSQVLWKYNGSAWSDITGGTLFISPAAVAVDQAGNIYIVDKAAASDPNPNQIRKKASGGSTWSVVGNWNNGGFTNVVAISTDIDNNLYAIEAISASGSPYSRLVRLASGSSSWLPYPGLPNTLNIIRVPNDLVVDRFGNVYVSDHNTQVLHVFAKNATLWAQIRRDNNVSFTDIYSVAVDNRGYVYVSDPAVDFGSPNRRVLRHQPWVTLLNWQIQPGGAQAYGVLNPNPVASLNGPNGDRIIGVVSADVTVSLTVPNGANLSGTTSLGFTDGSASFTDLSVDKPGTYSLTALATIASENIKHAVYDFETIQLTKVSNNFTISPAPQAAAPSANPPSGSTVVDGGMITLSSTTPGAQFHYTTDGSTPNSSSPVGSVITLSGAHGNVVTVKAYTSAPQHTDSSVATFTYQIQYIARLPLIWK